MFSLSLRCPLERLVQRAKKPEGDDDAILPVKVSGRPDVLIYGDGSLQHGGHLQVHAAKLEPPPLMR